jgi:hypothetical protein
VRREEAHRPKRAMPNQQRGKGVENQDLKIEIVDGRSSECQGRDVLRKDSTLEVSSASECAVLRIAVVITHFR